METNNSNHHIELQIVAGETSGIFKIDPRTGSIEFAPDISHAQWLDVLRLAKTLNKKSAVAVADCIAFGTKAWSRKTVDFDLEQLELEATLVKTAIAVNSIPREMRFENLYGDHYVELAKADLPKAKKLWWARVASEQRLTAVQLRFSIIEGEVVDRSVTKILHTGVYTVQGVRQSFDVWLRRVGGLEGVKAMEPDHQIEIMEELDAICEFGMQLHEHLSQMHTPAPAA